MALVCHRHAWLRLLLGVSASVACGAAPAADAPATAAPAQAVVVGGEVAAPLRLDAVTLAKLPRERVEAAAHGVSGTWEGVALVEVLRAAGVPLGDTLRGANLML